ncbi:GNAT family N-acetyltransferase [Porphyromonas uenonis]|uniref:GNAT family N-acetyltransferase n=1 Tax=Porphyromonas uenonis TaxID=281920 RepID=UPI002673F09C|nr:hypothetical protein [Porphyromonas uenonis]
MNNVDNADRIYVFRKGIETLNEVEPRYDRPYKVVKKRGACKSFTNLFWHIFSGFTFYKYSIIDVESGDEIAYTHVSTGLPHFDFIHRLGGGYHIGPDFTVPKYRGKGFHPFILTYAIRDLLNLRPDVYIYMCVSQGNTSSIKGIERVGFHFCGRMKREEYQYKLIEGTELLPIKRKPRKIWKGIFHCAYNLNQVLKR